MTADIERMLSQDKKDLKNIFSMIRKRDFKGNTGMAVKNSIFQFSSQIISKLGAMILTIILARILAPDLFGLYNLSLSVILIFTTFAELGLGQALIRFVSVELGKKNEKIARAFYLHFRKIKFFLVLVSLIALAASADFISSTYFDKPIFLALLAGILYIVFFEIVSFIQSAIQSFNYFKGIFHYEIVFETSRLILVPLATLLILRYSSSTSIILMFIFIGLSISYLISSIFIYFFQYKRVNPLPHLNVKLDKLNVKESNKFLLASSALALSGTFFGYVDKIVLGHFVSAEFIGYYSAAFNLTVALAAIVGFGTVLLPIFSRIDATQLERGMAKSIRSTFIIDSLLFVGTLLFSSVIIKIIYGPQYIDSINMLRVLSPLLLIVPLINVYSTYFLSKGRPKILILLLIISTIINISVSYLLISYLLHFGELVATYGVIISVIVSNLIYLMGLLISKKFAFKRNLKDKGKSNFQ